MRKIETDGNIGRFNCLLREARLSMLDVADLTNYSYETIRKWSKSRGAPEDVIEKLRAHVAAMKEIWGIDD